MATKANRHAANVAARQEFSSEQDEASRRYQNTPTKQATPPVYLAALIRVALVDSNRAEALGLVACSSAPLCALCRKLIRAGLNPELPVEAYRGGVLALRARSLLAAARLT